MKPDNVSDLTFASVMQALHYDILVALDTLSMEQVRDVVAFALAEYEHDEAIQRCFRLRYARETYKEACRAFRKRGDRDTPEHLRDHLWQVGDAVLEMELPVELQYHPLTQAMQERRQEAVDGYFSSEYEKSQGW